MAEQADENGWAPLDPAQAGFVPADLPADQRPPPLPYDLPYDARALPPHDQGAVPPSGPVWPAPYEHPYGQPPPRRPWTAEAPPGTPYYRMTRTAAQRWWQAIAGTAAILATGLAAMFVVLIVGAFVQFLATGDDPGLDGGGSDGPVFGGGTAGLTFELGSLAVFLPIVLLAAWVFQRRRPGTLSSVAGRIRWRWLLICSGLAVLACVLSLVTAWLASQVVDEPAGNDTWVGWREFAGPAIVILLLVPFQAAAEEYFFRGWLLQSIAGCTLETRRARIARALSVVFRTPWPAIVISGAVFVLGHGYTGWGMVDIFCFAAIAGWLAVRTGGLEASVALHVFNNLMAFLLPAAVGQIEVEQGAVPWQFVAADVTPMVVYAVVIAWMARRRRLPTVTGAPGDASGVPAAELRFAGPQPDQVAESQG